MAITKVNTLDLKSDAINNSEIKCSVSSLNWTIKCSFSKEEKFEYFDKRLGRKNQHFCHNQVKKFAINLEFLPDMKACLQNRLASTNPLKE